MRTPGLLSDTNLTELSEKFTPIKLFLDRVHFNYLYGGDISG